jgi:ubiquinone/menaquinone biosynthesis C-methylase UbiE
MQLPRRVRLTIKRITYGGIGAGKDGERVVAWIAPRPGMRVADIGAGFGDFAFRFGRAVAPDGVVYAVDTDPDLRTEVARRAAERGLADVRPVAATTDDPGIPDSVDLVFLSSSYHHLPEQVAYFTSIRPRIRPGGRVVILEGKPSLTSRFLGHATPPEDVRTTLEQAGYRLVGSADIVRWESLQAFEPAPSEPGGEEQPVGEG